MRVWSLEFTGRFLGPAGEDEIGGFLSKTHSFKLGILFCVWGLMGEGSYKV